MNERHCVNKVNFIYKNKRLVGFGPWVNYFMNLLTGSSKHLTKGADGTVSKAVPRDTREDVIYTLAYIICVLYWDHLKR